MHDRWKCVNVHSVCFVQLVLLIVFARYNTFFLNVSSLGFEKKQ